MQIKEAKLFPSFGSATQQQTGGATQQTRIEGGSTTFSDFPLPADRETSQEEFKELFPQTLHRDIIMKLLKGLKGKVTIDRLNNIIKSTKVFQGEDTFGNFNLIIKGVEDIVLEIKVGMLDWARLNQSGRQVMDTTARE